MDYKIELKSVKIYESLSEETTCFTANLYINGKCIGTCENGGKGGNTHIRGNDKECNQLILKVDEWCKKKQIQHTDNTITWDCLEDCVDELIEKKLLEQEEKKLQRHCVSDLCFTEYGEGEHVLSYYRLGWKGVKNLEEMLKNPKGKETIIKTIKTELSKGKRLLNKNIPENLYK